MSVRIRRVVRWPYRHQMPDWNDVSVDPGGSMWGPGPYLKVASTWHEGSGPADDQMRQRVYSPLGYPGDRRKIAGRWCRVTSVRVARERGRWTWDVRMACREAKR